MGTEGLAALLGEWSIEVSLPGAPPGDIGARVRFEWMPGERFLVQRWQIPVPEAPDGLAVIGFDEGRGTLLQHYFDSRGVARVYAMTLAGGVWTLSREEARLLACRLRAALRGDASARTAARSKGTGTSAMRGPSGRRTSTSPTAGCRSALAAGAAQSRSRWRRSLARRRVTMRSCSCRRALGRRGSAGRGVTCRATFTQLDPARPVALRWAMPCRARSVPFLVASAARARRARRGRGGARPRCLASSEDPGLQRLAATGYAQDFGVSYAEAYRRLEIAGPGARGVRPHHRVARAALRGRMVRQRGRRALQGGVHGRAPTSGRRGGSSRSAGSSPASSSSSSSGRGPSCWRHRTRSPRGWSRLRLGERWSNGLTVSRQRWVIRVEVAVLGLAAEDSAAIDAALAAMPVPVERVNVESLDLGIEPAIGTWRPTRSSSSTRRGRRCSAARSDAHCARGRGTCAW